ncbi:MAG: hypothetical protein AB7N76_03010 [Planctomycetota bacterium]
MPRDTLESLTAGQLEDETGWHGGDSLTRVVTRLIRESLVHATKPDQASLKATRPGREWLAANLSFASHEAFMRAGLALMRLALPRWRQDLGDDWRLPRVCETLEDWIECPCDPCWQGWLFWHRKTPGISGAIELMRRESQEATIRLEVCGELAPWALGLKDPVRERAEARRLGRQLEEDSP